jgi:hypothetical protein
MVTGNIASIKERGGISDSETSMIGGAARRGSDGNGSNMNPARHNIADEFVSRMGGNATKGETGPDSGTGKTS